jgi:predicted HNH restriction endonuclease
LIISNNQHYSEAHHIVPLGSPHNGVDLIKNMLCVCPNCHMQLDLGAIKVDIANLTGMLHRINEHFVDHHNTVIYQN